jgi:hypothetical protein
MDISDTIIANSEQVGADDLLAGPVTATITGVEKGTAEQPVFIHLDAFPGRTYRPAKSMRRILIAAWGAESSTYIGRSITVYNDPTVRWAGQAVGGVRISGLSHIDKPLTVALTVSRGKRSPYVVQPIAAPKDTSGRDWLKELTATDGDLDAIFKLGTEARTAGASDAIINVILSEYKKVEPNP